MVDGLTPSVSAICLVVCPSVNWISTSYSRAVTNGRRGINPGTTHTAGGRGVRVGTGEALGVERASSRRRGRRSAIKRGKTKQKVCLTWELNSGKALNMRIVNEGRALRRILHVHDASERIGTVQKSYLIRYKNVSLEIRSCSNAI